VLKVYVCGGPNPRKITILLEELGVPYEWELVDVYDGKHLTAEYRAVNPNGRLPALSDTQAPGGPLLIWESGAILQYLAEKHGRFLAEGRRRYEVLKWVYFQVAHAPYLGQAHLYRVLYREAMPFDIKRFTLEATRIYQVMNDQLADAVWIAGDDYSIADMAWFPWIEYHEWQGQSLERFPNLMRWFATMGERPAVTRGRKIPWRYGEFGPSAAGKRATELIPQRLQDPAFALTATDADGALANLILA
jgi:GST-like protein